MIAAVYELFIGEAFKIRMGSSVQEINAGLHASISVCKFQFIFVKASLVVKLLCTFCESLGRLSLPMHSGHLSGNLAVGYLEKLTKVCRQKSESWQVHCSVYTTDECSKQLFYAFSRGLLVLRTASSCYFWHREQRWVTAEFARRLHSRRWTEGHRGQGYSQSNLMRAAQSTGGAILLSMDRHY